MTGNVRSLCFAVLPFIVSGSLFVVPSNAQTAPATERATVSGTTPATLRIPAGMSFSVRLMRALDSRTVTVGTQWAGILVNDIVTAKGQVIAHSGEVAAGVVASVQQPTADHPASMSLRAQSLNGTELESMERTSSARVSSQGGYTPPNGRISLESTPAGTSNTGARGFATATTSPGQVTLPAGATLNFQTTAP